MSDEALAGFVTETAGGLGVTGAAVGVRADGREVFASHGVTSVENPLPVRPDTLFLIGSATKTFTATTMMRLVADGKVALDAPVRRVAAMDVFVAYQPLLEDAILPQPEDLYRAMAEIAAF